MVLRHLSMLAGIDHAYVLESLSVFYHVGKCCWVLQTVRVFVLRRLSYRIIISMNAKWHCDAKIISSHRIIRKVVSVMCDVKKYSDIYKEIKKLTPDDTLQLVLESETEEEKSFYEVVGDFLLQKAQKEAIERNVF